MKKTIVLFFICLMKSLFPQTIIVFAGGGQGDGLPAVNQSIEPHNVFNDSINNIYFNSSNSNGFTSIRKVDVSTGIISTLAGTNSPLIQGVTGNASIAYIDHAYMYICHDNYLKKVNLNNNAITVVAGNGIQGYTGDGGQATNASINMFLYNRMCIDVAGNIYMSDDANDCIRKINASTNIISTFLNQTNAPFLDMPYGLCFDGLGNLYIGNNGSHVVLKASTTTSVTSIYAGLLNTSGYTGDGGLATNARIDHPFDLKFDSGNLYICDDANDCIRKVDASGFISTFIGSGLDGPRGFCFDGLGNTYISDNIHRGIIKRNSLGVFSGIAGNAFGNFSGDGSLATNANVRYPSKLAKDVSGSIYFVDQGLSQLGLRVRKVNSSGIISTIAGYGSSGFSGDGGQAINAQFDQISDICVDQAGNLYIADSYNKRVRKVNLSSGIITTFAGNGSATASGDGGAATSAGLGTPKAIATDVAGNLYISNGTSTIRVVNAVTGIITAFAGGGFTLGDGGLAINANIGAVGMCFDSQGNMIIGDYANKRIRKINLTSGIINTIAGNGIAGYNYYGSGINPLTTPLGFIFSICIDGNDNIYIGTSNSKILKLNATNTLLSGIAEGIGTIVNGVPVEKATCNAYGIINDYNGNILFSDINVNKITINCTTSPTLTLGSDITQCNVPATITAASSSAIYYYWALPASSNDSSISVTSNGNYIVTVTDNNGCSASDTVSVTLALNCSDVWPGDANSDGVANNLDVLELGLHYWQTGASRSSVNNNWQSYFANNWTGTISNGKNLNHSDCNGDGIINDSDTLAIYNNYGLTHAFKPVQTNTVNPQLSIVPDQTAVIKGNWGTASIYLGDATSLLNNINGLAFAVDFDNTLIETNNIYIEYQSSFLDAGQNLRFRKLDFANGKIYTATTHTVNNNVNGFGKIATLHYQIKSTLTSAQVLNLGISQANQSNASGVIVPLTSGTGSLTATIDVGLQEFLNSSTIFISPNPTNGLLTINSKTELQKIEVVSITGQTLLSETPTNVSHTLHLDNFSNGIYFVNVYQNDRIVKREKIVLNK